MKKRVLAFVPEFPVISETFIEREMAQLAQSTQIEFKVFSSKKAKGTLSDNLLSKTEYIKLSPLDILVGFCQFIFSNYAGVIDCFKLAGLRRLYLLTKSFGYAFLFQEFDPQIIYAHFLSDSSTIGLFCSTLLSCELAISGHARDVTEYPDLVEEKLNRSKFITICNRTAFNHLARINPDKMQKVHLIYHGMDISKFAIPNSKSYSSVKRLVSVGRLVEKKGFTYLLEAVKLLKAKNITTKLEIVGTGPIKESLLQLAKDLNLENEVFFVGELGITEVIKKISECDVYVQPSINLELDSDGIPNTLIEASMLKAPIVTTDAGSITDFLNKKSAVIVPQRDPMAIAQAIETLLTNEVLSHSLGLNAYTKAKEMFDLKDNVSKIETLLIL